eukprot:CAMPEP_0174828510 /NCGR_PEP_ID=MMETSP1114-20130205/1377_1 /TAXON_ID=312471 /ORGANISM="Neobodo designis, Strain CCAP 1951/1" /LENGTH=38 /DNA_ID= /DNA_START= /DNA_END= /DNA_ORIENTATION=
MKCFATTAKTQRCAHVAHRNALPSVSSLRTRFGAATLT